MRSRLVVGEDRPEAIHTFVQPEPHNIMHLIPNLWVLPIQIRLFRCEDVEIILISCFVIFPCTSSPNSTPVIRRLPLPIFVVLGLLPDVVIAVLIIFGFLGFLKPFVLFTIRFGVWMVSGDGMEKKANLI